MQELKIFAAQLAPLLLTVLGAVSWTGTGGNRRLAISLWILAIGAGTVVALVEIRTYREQAAEKLRIETARAKLTPLIDNALSKGESLEYAVRDDKDTNADAMYQRHFAAIEAWRTDVARFLREELPGTVAESRFRAADGEYMMGPLRFEVTRMRRQRENLALIYDNLDTYIVRSSRKP